MLSLAAPVALGELGWMSMSVVDTIMVGGLGPAAIGATGVGGSLFYVFAIFGVGLLFGLDTLVSQSFGRGDREDCHRSLGQALWIALLLVPIIMSVVRSVPFFFPVWGVNPGVSREAIPFLLTLSWSTLPLLLYGATRRYLQGVGHVRPVMFTLISANLINWFANWLLIYGHWGFPRLGVVGSALSTCLARLYMAGLIAVYLIRIEHAAGFRIKTIFRRPEIARIVQLLNLGLPAASQIILEIGAFSVASVLASRMSAVALAAHQVAISCASVSYMVPLGISSAAAVGVGQAIGAGQFARARRAGYIALIIACVFAVCAASLFIVLPLPILRIYTADREVQRVGIILLALAALFQLADGTQTVLTGALRGAGKTKSVVLANLVGYYLVGLPLGWQLGFRRGFGIVGLWEGLTFALIGIAAALLWEWNRESRRLGAAAG